MAKNGKVRKFEMAEREALGLVCFKVYLFKEDIIEIKKWACEDVAPGYITQTQLSAILGGILGDFAAHIKKRKPRINVYAGLSEEECIQLNQEFEQAMIRIIKEKTNISY